MPITARPVRPEFLVGGVVASITPRRRYDNENKRFTDEVVGHELTLTQPNGSQFQVRVPLDRETGFPPVPLPDVLGNFDAVAELSESREYGVSLTVTRPVSPDDLDRIASRSLALSSGKG
jgi:hypothetical protein